MLNPIFSRRGIFGSLFASVVSVSLSAVQGIGKKAKISNVFFGKKYEASKIEDTLKSIDINEMSADDIVIINDENMGLLGYKLTHKGLSQEFRAVTFQSLLAPSAAGSIGYRPFNYLRGVGDKLDENRSALDFIPRPHHGEVVDGTSTWDAAGALNAGLMDVGGRPVDFTHCKQISIGQPIELVRGSKIYSRCTFDNHGIGGTKIFLLDGSNCPMLLSPKAKAVLGDFKQLYTSTDEHNYVGVEGFVFDGNAARQTKTTELMKLGAIQWFGEYIGTEFQRNLIFNTRGCGVSFIGDVSIDNIWVLQSYFDRNEYSSKDDRERAYSIRFNPELSNDEAKGIYTIGSMFCELPRNSFGVDVKKSPAHRESAIHLNRTLSFAATRIHTEAALYGVSLSSCRSVSILEYSGAWMGGSGGGDNDWSGISICDDATRKISLMGGMVFGGSTPRDYKPVAPVKKRKGVICPWLPDIEAASYDGIIGPYLNADPRAVSKASLMGRSFDNTF